jgi:ribosome-associated translation inhibitor RaiA/cold shock CspA family protein
MGMIMDVPLEISFNNLDASEAIEERIRARTAKLNKIYGRLVSCRVAVEAPHRQHRKGNLYTVRIDMTVPGGELVVNRAPQHAQKHRRDPDLPTIINDAFSAAERQLKQYKERQRGEVKPHDQALAGSVTGLRPEEDHGFLLSAEGRELYFHRDSLVNGDFDDLRAGDRVHYVEAVGATGPTASKVWRATSETREGQE